MYGSRIVRNNISYEKSKIIETKNCLARLVDIEPMPDVSGPMNNRHVLYIGYLLAYPLVSVRIGLQNKSIINELSCKYNEFVSLRE